MDLLALFLRFADQGRQTQFVGRGVEHLARQPVFTYQDTAGGVLRRIAPVDQDSFKTGNIQQTRQIAAESRRTVDDHFVTASRNGRRSGDFRLLLQIAYKNGCRRQTGTRLCTTVSDNDALKPVP